MTKARTVAEAKRAKRGRSPIDVPRDGSGRAIAPARRAKTAAAEMDEMRPALVRRCMRLRWPIDEAHLRKARDARLANAGGVLLALGWITEDRYLALAEYSALRIKWARLHGAPHPHPKVCPWAREYAGGAEQVTEAALTFAGCDDDPGKAQQAASDALRAAGGVLTCSEADTLNVLMDAGEEWEPPTSPEWLAHVRLLSSKLARHFGHRA